MFRFSRERLVRLTSGLSLAAFSLMLLSTTVSAQELKVGYSYFRQVFKARTGLSPKQYQLQVRLHKAQDLLANTSRSVSEIAEILGFNTAFHLSAQFKNHVGLAPLTWRKRLAGTRRSIMGYKF